MIHTSSAEKLQADAAYAALVRAADRAMTRPFVLNAGVSQRCAPGGLRDAGTLAVLARRVYGDKDFRKPSLVTCTRLTMQWSGKRLKRWIADHF